jgi:hypothetical protein
MREFFKGWRRKTGCVALVMACALAGEWMRASVTEDAYLLTPQHAIVSGDGYMTVVFTRRHGPQYWYMAFTKRVDSGPGGSLKWEQRWRWGVAGVGCGVDVLLVNGTEEDEAKWCRIPYWGIILPLTLLSAYLILWKPRTKPKEQPHA